MCGRPPHIDVSLPLSLSLKKKKDRVDIFLTFVKELAVCHISKIKTMTQSDLTIGESETSKVTKKLFEIRIHFHYY